MIEARFDANARESLVLVMEPPAPRALPTDTVDAAASLFAVLERAADPGVSRSQLR
jgi:hypothetical protein